MESKLSKLQKQMLTSIYNIKEIDTHDLFSDHQSYNSSNFALHSLIKRGLVEKINTGKYIKLVGLTVKGKKLVEELGFGTNEIKFTLSFGKLKAMLDKLSFNGMCLYSAITVKDNTLFSYQKGSFGTFIRETVFRKSYFNEITGNRTIVIRTEDVLLDITGVPANELVTIETKDKELLVYTKTAGTVYAKLGRFTDATYQLKPYVTRVNGVPHLKDVVLDTHFSIKLLDLNRILKSTKRRGEPKPLHFLIKDNKITVRVGGEFSASAYRIFEPNVEVFSKENIDMDLHFDSDSVSKTFTQDMIHIYTKPDYATWVYEESKDYSLGVLLIN